jgi:hypothetical protein
MAVPGRPTVAREGRWNGAGVSREASRWACGCVPPVFRVRPQLARPHPPQVFDPIANLHGQLSVVRGQDEVGSARW